MAAHALARERAAENRFDVALVLRVLAGDRAAEVELYHKYHTRFLNWIRRWLRHKEWADDFAEEAVIQLFQVLPQYRPELSSFSTWAHRVAYTKVMKCIRDLHTERDDVSADDLFLEFLPALTGPEDDYVASRLHEEVACLEREQRAAVGGPYFDGLNDTELAARLRMPRRRVCYRRRQGMAALRRRLKYVPFTSIRPRLRFSGYNIYGGS
jgi:RNA polymerase sigma factor (sigma-70 family)